MDAFQVPDGMTGRFAVVKLWPGLKVAEDEVIARLKLTARTLGLECLEIASDGRAVAPPHLPVKRAEVDFAIHLHFETPKAYDLFSFAALWNPLRIIHNYQPDGGAAKFARYMASHDDFLSCGAESADDHIRRALGDDPTRDGPHFRLYHSLSQPVLEPTTGDGKLFYAGINWDRLGQKGKSRHQELLDLLDATGELRIHGPHSLLGVRVWDGYRSYCGPLPFDGVSVVHAIHRAGVSLVLASDAHKEAGIMSCRLFESLAAGAVVICDDHPFAKQHFGDSLLAVDTSGSVQDAFEQILGAPPLDPREPRRGPRAGAAGARHLHGQVHSRPQPAGDLRGVRGPEARVDRRLGPAEEVPATLFLLMPRYDREVLNRHLESVQSQEYAAADYVLLADAYELTEFGGEIAEQLRTSRKKIECRAVAFAERSPTGKVLRRVSTGRVLHDVANSLPDGMLCGFVGPQERLTADHLRALAGVLERKKEAAWAYTDAVARAALPRPDGSQELSHLVDLNPLGWDPDRPFGPGRFLFRVSGGLLDRLGPVMRYLHHKPLGALAIVGPAARTRRVTVLAGPVDAPPPEEVKFEDDIFSTCLPDTETAVRPAPRAAIHSPVPPPTPSQPPPTLSPGLLRRAFRAIPMPRALRTTCWKLFSLLRQTVRRLV